MEPLKKPFKQPLQKTFDRDGKTYGMIVRSNGLAGYAVSKGSEAVYYRIFLISAQKGREFLIASDEDPIQYFDDFLKLWNIMNGKRKA